jgi:hypothetical protein
MSTILFASQMFTLVCAVVGSALLWVAVQQGHLSAAEGKRCNWVEMALLWVGAIGTAIVFAAVIISILSDDILTGFASAVLGFLMVMIARRQDHQLVVERAVSRLARNIAPTEHHELV